MRVEKTAGIIVNNKWLGVWPLAVMKLIFSLTKVLLGLYFGKRTKKCNLISQIADATRANSLGKT